ncbi:MAG TPA: hypothetical protein VME20_07265 [Acidimicrobiales bacterium]|nr:hypothetical protein [Acidimicrobiales bacterium]
MHFRWPRLLAITAITVTASTSAASASVSPSVLSQWKRAEAAFAPADNKWSAVIESSTAPTLGELVKANNAFVPAVKAFDSALGKISFTGKTAKDILALMALNQKEVTVLSHTTSVKGFESGLVPLVGKYMSLQGALSKDLGIPAAEIIL